MRKAARIDANQPEIVEKLRAYGASVFSTAPLGKGFGDVAVGMHGLNFLFEIKQPGKRKDLTDAETKFHSDWKGQIHTIETFEECVEIIEKIAFPNELPF